ncbi:MAG: ATP-binding protein [Coriobacteriia bacterium]|nr:ATP-binding protein [Coriobacteriia bacterium]
MTNSMQSLNGRLTVAVASGKGGTGKTLVATNLAVAAARSGTPAALVDCDADAPNDALFLAPASPQVREVMVPLPVVDEDACTLCGACRTACSYGAIRILGGKVMVFPELCHNCGACVRACRSGALSEVPVRVGEVEWGSVAADIAAPGGVDVVTGRLDIGEVKTPTVVRAARKQAEVLHKTLTILDSPPGVACAAVASIRDADVLVLVTEPTPFGLHDLELTVELGREMGIPIGVVINRDTGVPSEVEAYCDRSGIPILSRILFDRRVAEIYASGGLVIDGHPDGDEWFTGLWRAVCALAEEDV